MGCLLLLFQRNKFCFFSVLVLVSLQSRFVKSLAHRREEALERSPIKIALIPKINLTFFGDAWRGCQKEALKESKKRNRRIKCDFLIPNSDFENDEATADQVRILERIMTNRTHEGVAISVNDASELTPVINRVVESGIPVLTFDSDAPDSKRCCYVGTNNTDFGDQLAKVLLQLKPSGGTYAIVTSYPAGNIAERVAGVRNGLKDTKWVESKTSPKDGKGNSAVSLNAMREIVAEDPSIDAIIPVAMWPMSNATAWKGFVNEHKNLTYVVGDSSREQYELMTHGYGNALIGQMPYEMGSLSLAYLVKEIVEDGITQPKTIHGTNILQILQVPLHLPDLVIDNNHLGSLRILTFTLFGIVITTVIGFWSWTWRNKTSRVVTASQPFFLYLILAGTTIFSSSVITFSIDDEYHSQAGCNVACTLNMWFISIGFTVIFAALYSKASRVNKIMKAASKFKRVKVMPKDVLLPFVVLMLINVAILMTWTIYNHHSYQRFVHPGMDEWNRQFSYYGRCTSLHSEVYYSLMFSVNMIALILALYETYKTRNLRTEFNESAYIGIVFISILQAAVIGIPVVAVTGDQPRISIPVAQVVIFFTCMATLLFMFVPKILSLRKKRKARHKNRGRGTLTQQYLEKMKAEQEEKNQTEYPFHETKYSAQHSGLVIRKFEPKLITSVDPAAGSLSRRTGKINFHRRGGILHNKNGNGVTFVGDRRLSAKV